jgi:hypothetical protein
MDNNVMGIVLGSSKRFILKVQHTIIYTSGVVNFKTLKRIPFSSKCMALIARGKQSPRTS